ncbi:hypothetical protein LIER_04857 [Lithospermum erythrorhizon]|uniref:Uncharacterized protein n=1 Tax=Lithospermum erythrorhizon TaxID=34254 RepID=A0AAV3NYA1_LITER
MWMLNDNFDNIVESNWVAPMEGSEIQVFWAKLKRFKICLKKWNREFFGDIFAGLRKIEEEMQIQEKIVQNDDTPSNREKLARLKSTNLQFLAKEAAFWEQRTGMEWVKNGDRSTSQFMNYVKKKRKKSKIHGIQVGDQWIEDKKDLSDFVVEHFKSLLATDASSTS